MVTGVYPGSFDPPTVAHLHVAEVARRQCRLDRVVFSLSRAALGKSDAALTPIGERAEVLRAVAATRSWLGVAVTDARLVADVAAGFDVVIMGADKWHQILDPAWYGSAAARDAALARLPTIAVAPRAGSDLPTPPAGITVVVLDVDERHHDVSATGARLGRHDWVLPEAQQWWTARRQPPGKAPRETTR